MLTVLDLLLFGGSISLPLANASASRGATRPLLADWRLMQLNLSPVRLSTFLGRSCSSVNRHVAAGLGVVVCDSACQVADGCFNSIMHVINVISAYHLIGNSISFPPLTFTATLHLSTVLSLSLSHTRFETHTPRFRLFIIASECDCSMQLAITVLIHILRRYKLYPAVKKKKKKASGEETLQLR